MLLVSGLYWCTYFWSQSDNQVCNVWSVKMLQYFDQLGCRT
jgi:hypothetical protein